jgi:hypothetical protein
LLPTKDIILWSILGIISKAKGEKVKNNFQRIQVPFF